eukprot:COSAG01_NODE_550_length_15593_cov_12.422422_1_plen_161_part_00
MYCTCVCVCKHFCVDSRHALGSAAESIIASACTGWLCVDVEEEEEDVELTLQVTRRGSAKDLVWVCIQHRPEQFLLQRRRMCPSRTLSDGGHHSLLVGWLRGGALARWCSGQWRLFETRSVVLPPNSKKGTQGCSWAYVTCRCEAISRAAGRGGYRCQPD